MKTASLGGSKYFVCFTCNHSRLRIVYFLKKKSETVEKINEMLQGVRNQCGRSVKIFQCDGGLEFNNEAVRKLLKSNGVTLAISNLYTPEQNGCAERTNRTVVELLSYAISQEFAEVLMGGSCQRSRIHSQSNRTESCSGQDPI